ncbi:MAG: hypothetical protein ACYC4L_18800 [Chloroflexota bacterium]
MTDSPARWEALVPGRLRYCPLEAGEVVDEAECQACPFRPAPPYRICAPPRNAKPRRRGFWDREPDPD